MKNLYHKTSYFAFKLRSIAYCIFVDFFVVRYALDQASYQFITNKISEQISLLNLDSMVFNDQQIDELVLKIQYFVYSMIALYIVFHITMYFLFFKNKTYAKTYLKILTLSGLFLIPIFSAIPLIEGLTINLPYLILLLPYGYVYFGLKFFKNQVTEKPHSPPDERKE